MSDNTQKFHEMSSPPCYAYELDLVHRGTLASQDVLAGMQVLLEGERAGARVARESLNDAKTANTRSDFCDWIMKIQQAKVASCKMLVSEIKRHGGKPSTGISTFYNRAIAIKDLTERLCFMNHDEERALHKIDELLPQITDEALIASLKHLRDVTAAMRVSTC